MYRCVCTAALFHTCDLHVDVSRGSLTVSEIRESFRNLYTEIYAQVDDPGMG